MTNQKVIGLVCLAAGIGFVCWGYTVGNSIGGQLGSVFSGSISTKELLAYCVGAISLLVGLKKIK